jgi:hypothetical protein
MAGKWIEVSATYVDRDVEPNQSRSEGMIRWNAEDPASGAESINPFDPKVIVMLKAFIKKYEHEVDDLRVKLERI